MFLVKVAAGLALIIFGVRFLRKGLDRLLGGQLIVWLERMTHNRAQAMGAGVVTGILAPSSTGLSLLTAQILGNTSVDTAMMLAVLMGANVGMTILANVAAVQVGDYSGVLLFLGVLGFQFATVERIRGIGQCLLSLGFIFLAMDFLKSGTNDFSNSHDVSIIFGVLDNHPYVLGAAAAVLAVLLQSSTATVGLGIGLATGGVLPGSLFMDWIIGTNIGLGFTSLFVSRGNLEGRRLGLANLLAKVMVAVLIIACVPRNLLLAAPVPIPQQLALMHTAFNLLVALISLPLLNWLLLLVGKILVPGPIGPGQEPKSFLNPEALETPALALAHATRETLRMTDEVKVMLQNLWAAHTRQNVAPVKGIRAQDDAVDEMNQQVMLYLSQLGEMNNFDRKWHFTLLTYSSELEAIGDAIEKNLAGTVVKQLTDNFSLDPDDEAVLGSLYQKTRLQFDLAAGFITSREVVSSQKIINAKDEINAWCLEQKKTHYERLKPGGIAALAKSLCFLDLLEGLRRINNHLSTAAYGFKSTAPRLRQTRMKLEPEPKAPLAKPVFGPVPPAPENPQLL